MLSPKFWTSCHTPVMRSLGPVLNCPKESGAQRVATEVHTHNGLKPIINELCL